MSTEITKTEPGTLATIPDDLKQYAGRGTENIGTEDVRPPRLLLCQSGSPQRKPGDAKQIKGLDELMMFNDLSQEIYGTGPLKIIVINMLGTHYIQFAPMEEGGGVIDFNVKPDDPRTQFTTNERGERVKPIATKFYDYLIWLPEKNELAAFSLKSTGLKVAIKLNGLLKLPLKLEGAVLMDPPSWARTFSLTTAMEKKDAFAWGNYNLKPEGLTPPEIRQLCAQLQDTYAKKNIIIERDDDAFDEASAGTGEAGREAVPF